MKHKILTFATLLLSIVFNSGFTPVKPQKFNLPDGKSEWAVDYYERDGQNESKHFVDKFLVFGDGVAVIMSNDGYVSAAGIYEEAYNGLYLRFEDDEWNKLNGMWNYTSDDEVNMNLGKTDEKVYSALSMHLIKEK